jgi:hypothetical protein
MITRTHTHTHTHTRFLQWKIQQDVTAYQNVITPYFKRSSTCFGWHTTQDQEPKTAQGASGFVYVEGCRTCSCWTLSGSVCVAYATSCWIFHCKNCTMMHRSKNIKFTHTHTHTHTHTRTRTHTFCLTISVTASQLAHHNKAAHSANCPHAQQNRQEDKWCQAKLESLKEAHHTFLMLSEVVSRELPTTFST